jgi:fructokinase
MYAAIEAGGTKWVCAVGSSPDEIIAVERFSTTSPEETLGHAIRFFQPFSRDIKAIGVGSFGPIDLHPDSPDYGFITTTPKEGWQFTDVVGPLREAFHVPVGFDTDVNAAALGEFRWGAAQGLDTFVYITVGTGLGGGAMVNGKLLHGLLHPEMGHMLLPHEKLSDQFAGACSFHGDCLEGMVSGPALEKRWQARGETLPSEHPAWQHTAHSLALGLVNIICILSPQRIILGGGVMHQPQLFPVIHSEVQRLINHYLRLPQITRRINEYIVPPGLGDRAGMLGAMALAEQAINP